MGWACRGDGAECGMQEFRRWMWGCGIRGLGYLRVKLLGFSEAFSIKVSGFSEEGFRLWSGIGCNVWVKFSGFIRVWKSELHSYQIGGSGCGGTVPRGNLAG